MRLVTERLIVRDYEKGDLTDFHEIFSNPAAMEQCEPPYDMQTSAQWLDYFIERPIAFAVVEKASGKMIGHALFKQLPGEEEGIYEIGWIYNERFWRRGYAYEASRALIEHGFCRMGLHKIVAETIDPIKSVSLMKKLGMKQEGVLRRHTRDNGGRWADVHWYGMLETDPRA